MMIINYSKNWQISIDQLFVSIFDHTEFPYYEKTIIDHNSILAIDGNRLVGFLLLSLTPNDIHEYKVSYLAVDEEYRNTGIATQMLDMVEPTVWLEVLNSNTEACNFYTKKGFKLYETFTTSDGYPASIFINTRKQELLH